MIQPMRKAGLLFRSCLHFKPTKNIFQASYSLVGQRVQDHIRNLLLLDKPCMIARFGSVELQSVSEYVFPASVKNLIKFSTNKIPYLGYSPSSIYAMTNNAGFFPAKKRELDKFGALMIECMPYVDVLGSWQSNEEFFKNKLSNVIKVPLKDLEPYYFLDNWMSALTGKNVLVIHPFIESILSQYNSNFSKIYDNENMHPVFNLQTLKAIQSLGGADCGFPTWFDALEWMKNEIAKREFDIAILGCGAYGFPLAAFIKSLGKKAIHLGGAVQYLFGINSHAIDSNHPLFHYVNEFWAYPLESERPANYLNVENGRYW